MTTVACSRAEVNDSLSISMPESPASTAVTEPTILENLTVIVPITEGDDSWRTLLLDLRPLPVPAQILLVGTSPQPDDIDEILHSAGLRCTIEWLCALRGRARQMNHGASCAAHQFLWFLHGDSRIGPHELAALAEALDRDRDALYYFDLEFLPDGPRWLSLNASGANLRSRFAGLPFGDQGFCLSRKLFWRLGGFDVSARYGEDHLLVWKAHRLRIPLQRIPASIRTSARKYARHGWARTTLWHLWLTVRQATPQTLKLVLSRLGFSQTTTTNNLNSEVLRSRIPRLLIFTKCPDPGLCKTRLIPSLGAVGATAVHERLIEHTLRWAHRMGQDGHCVVQVHFAGQDLDRLRSICSAASRAIVLRRQVAGDLGERLSAAFADAFRDGSPKVIAIGTDCPRLNSELVNEAIRLLDESDVVIGPAQDGGYYLIALNRSTPELFEGISWGESTVLEQTLDRARAGRLKVALLPTLQDIDDSDDLIEMKEVVGMPDSLHPSHQ